MPRGLSRPGKKRVSTEIVGHDVLRPHIYQCAVDVSRDIVLAMGERMILHVDTLKRKATPIDAYMTGCLRSACEKWRPLVRPNGLSKAIVRCATDRPRAGDPEPDISPPPEHAGDPDDSRGLSHAGVPIRPSNARASAKIFGGAVGVSVSAGAR